MLTSTVFAKRVGPLCLRWTETPCSPVSTILTEREVCSFSALSTMPFLRQLCIYCWISGIFLLPAQAVTPKTSRDVSKEPNIDKADFRDVSYEFIAKPQSWGLASEACETRGGKLLKYLDCEIKDFLSKVFEGLQTPSWWIGEGLMGSYDECVIPQGK